MQPIDADDLERIRGLVHRRLGRAVECARPIEAGLGTRRFYRLTLDAGDPGSVIARVEPDTRRTDGPYGIPSEPPLEPLRTFLAGNGLPMPALYARDELLGIDLLEDLGSTSLEQAQASATPERRRALYRTACTLIPRLQALHAPAERIPAFGRRLDEALIRSKAQKFLDWTVPWVLGRAASAPEAELVHSAFRHVAVVCEAAPARLAHRDFKAANLHVLKQDGVEPKLVLIDFQGAFLAPPEYDLVCLLRDAHVNLPEEEVCAHMERTRPELPDSPDAASFELRFELLCVIRLAKDVSHYLHAERARGDRRYLALVPGAFAKLRAATAHVRDEHAQLAELDDLFAQLADPIEHDRRLEGAARCPAARPSAQGRAR